MDFKELCGPDKGKAAKALIESAGSTKRFAVKLGFAKREDDIEPNTINRIDNWRKRGIPDKVLLDKEREIKRLIASMKSVLSFGKI